MRQRIPLLLLALVSNNLTVTLNAQTGLSRKTSFEVISIKENVSGQPGGPFVVDGARFIASNTTLRALLMFAFSLQDGPPLIASQFIALPVWVDDLHFDVQAKTEDQSRHLSRAEMRIMVQTLLEDRFQLKVHREQRVQQVYDLSVRKKDRLRLSEDQSPPILGEGRVRSGPSAPVPRGQLVAAFRGSQANVTGNAVPMADFVLFLRGRTNRSVVDKTNLKGLFDFRLSFTPDSSTNGPLSTGPTVVAPPVSPGADPSLFVAIEEQLGLKLQSSNGLVDVIVIDSVRKPSQN